RLRDDQRDTDPGDLDGRTRLQLTLEPDLDGGKELLRSADGDVDDRVRRLALVGDAGLRHLGLLGRRVTGELRRRGGPSSRSDNQYARRESARGRCRHSGRNPLTTGRVQNRLHGIPSMSAAMTPLR